MRVSVILATYDAPEWLEKVLWGYSVQSHRDFEIVVADDGSTEETANLIARMQEVTGMAIEHVWHEHRGFRKCTILNRAILAAAADYLVFSDGDCIPHTDFLARHAELSEPDVMLSGGCVRLPMEISRRITVEDVVFGRATDLEWLRGQGLTGRSNLRKLACNSPLAHVRDLLTTTRASLNGCNSSTWRDAVLRVNGFDERMEYGGLDRELGERLIHAGIRAKLIRHRAACVHLDHGRSYIREESLRRNREIRGATRRDRAVWTFYGIRRNAAESERRAA